MLLLHISQLDKKGVCWKDIFLVIILSSGKWGSRKKNFFKTPHKIRRILCIRLCSYNCKKTNEGILGPLMYMFLLYIPTQSERSSVVPDIL